MNYMFLFDIDGTLTNSRQKMTPDMEEFLVSIKDKVILGIVGGSDFAKASEQIGDNIFNLFQYVFSENGLVYYKNGELIHQKSLRTYFTQEQLNAFISKALMLIAELDIPIKTGTFIEFRNGMLNISPIGRACSKQERDDFEVLDKQNHYREKMIETLKEAFPDLELEYSIGGQISFDVYPKGTNKSFCLQYLSHIDSEIHFFGDKTSKGGNDHEIYIDNRVVGHHVNNYKETMEICKQLLNNN